MRDITDGVGAILLAGDWVLLLTALPLTLFIFYYARARLWRNNFVGRTLMYLAVSLLAYVLNVSASVFLGTEYFLREYVRLAVYALVLVTIWRLFVTLRYVQKNPEKAEAELRALHPSRKETNS